MKGIEQLPEEYSLAYDIDLQKNKKLMFFVNGIAIFIAILMAIIGVLLVPISSLFNFEAGLLSYIFRFIVIIVASVAYIILHELVHGFFMKRLSGIKPKYGFTGVYAYAGSNAYFDKSSYVWIALSPVVIIGLILLIINIFVSTTWFWVVYIIQITNISGAAGDIYVTCKFSKEPKDILVSDSGVAMKVYTRKSLKE